KRIGSFCTSTSRNSARKRFATECALFNSTTIVKVSLAGSTAADGSSKLANKAPDSLRSPNRNVQVVDHYHLQGPIPPRWRRIHAPHHRSTSAWHKAPGRVPSPSLSGR